MANIFRVTLVQSMYGQQLQNVMHFEGPSSDPAQMSALADEIETSWVQRVRTLQTSSLAYNRISVRLLQSQFPPFDKTVNLLGSFGNDDQMTTFSAYVLRLRSAIIGKQGRGRMYVGGILKGWTTNGFVTNDRITAWNVQIALLMGVFGPTGSSTFNLGICPSSPPFNITPVTSMQVAPTLGIQRRRNIGIGV